MDAPLVLADVNLHLFALINHHLQINLFCEICDSLLQIIKGEGALGKPRKGKILGTQLFMKQ